MNIRDYLIEHAGIDWQRLFANWRWLISGEFTVWLINRFGDLFIVYSDGSVHWLRLDTGAITRIAASRDDFGRQLDGGKADDWLMIPLVDRLVAAGKLLQPRECYAFLQIPILGGSYDVENVVVRDIEFQFAALGPIFEQLKDIPDGTQIVINVKR